MTSIQVWPLIKKGWHLITVSGGDQKVVRHVGSFEDPIPRLELLQQAYTAGRTCVQVRVRPGQPFFGGEYHASLRWKRDTPLHTLFLHGYADQLDARFPNGVKCGTDGRIVASKKV
jgi:hypothetical protein